MEAYLLVLLFLFCHAYCVFKSIFKYCHLFAFFMQEFFMSESCLVSKSAWESRIDELQSLVIEKGLINDKEQAVKAVKDGLFKAVSSRIPSEAFGVMFSGGVDSSVIAFLCRSL